MKTKAIVTGCFDPITKGHVDIIKRAAKMFDTIYVVALNNFEKTCYFSLEDRKTMLDLLKKELDGENISNVIFDAYDGLTVDYMHSKGIKDIVRGIRNTDDAKYEEMVKNAMMEYDPEFKTTILKSSEEYSKISSTLVRNKLLKNEDVSDLVPEAVITFLKNR